MKLMRSVGQKEDRTEKSAHGEVWVSMIRADRFA